jgi:hypothetical protein
MSDEWSEFSRVPKMVTVRPRVARQLAEYTRATCRYPAEVVNEALVRFLTERGYWPPPGDSGWTPKNR